jgi:phosphotransferase system enzyme I (PtsI)
MHPASLLAVKQVILRTDLAEITPLARRMLKTEDPHKLSTLLEKMNAL